jgi:hypothetical protein
MYLEARAFLSPSRFCLVEYLEIYFKNLFSYLLVFCFLTFFSTFFCFLFLLWSSFLQNRAHSIRLREDYISLWLRATVDRVRDTGWSVPRSFSPVCCCRFWIKEISRNSFILNEDTNIQWPYPGCYVPSSRLSHIQLWAKPTYWTVLDVGCILLWILIIARFYCDLSMASPSAKEEFRRGHPLHR